MSNFERYLYLASSYPYLEEDKNEQKLQPISKNSQSIPNQYKNDFDFLSFKQPDLGTKNNLNITSVDLNKFTANFDHRPSVYAQFFKEEVEKSVNDLSAYPYINQNYKTLMDENSSNSEESKTGNSSTLIETGNLSIDFSKSTACKKAACSIHRLFAEWFRGKLDQTKKDSENKEGDNFKPSKEWPDYKAYLFKR